ncbi:iron-sulfur cluster assembly accessory protein [Bradyrhizobium sp. F1.13.4]
MINLTDNAINALRAAISTTGQAASGLRIMVDGGGCEGFTYKMDLAHGPSSDDAVVELDGIKLFVDSATQEHLNGTTIDFVLSPEGSGFPIRQSKCQVELLLRQTVQVSLSSTIRNRRASKHGHQDCTNEAASDF